MRSLFLAIVLLISGCSSTKEPDFSILGEEFIPLKKGDFYIFFIAEKTFNTDGSADSVGYFLREEVGEGFTTSDERYVSYSINRFKKSSIEDSWSYFETISRRKNQFHVAELEGNIPVIAFSFPVGEGRRWDGNSQNDLSLDYFEQRDLGHPFTVDSLIFANTVHVIREDLLDPLCIRDDYRFEVYAENVGMVYRRFRQVRYVVDDGVERCTVETGKDIEQKLVSFGNN